MLIKNGTPVVGQQVHIYMNLQKPGYFSIVDDQKGSPTRGKVLAYVTSATLTGVRAHINHNKHAGIIAQQKRTVCAWFVGTLAAIEDVQPEGFQTAVTYNPYRRADFHTPAGDTVATADVMHFTDGRGYIAGEGDQPAGQLSLF